MRIVGRAGEGSQRWGARVAAAAGPVCERGLAADVEGGAGTRLCGAGQRRDGGCGRVRGLGLRAGERHGALGGGGAVVDGRVGGRVLAGGQSVDLGLLLADHVEEAVLLSSVGTFLQDV